MDPSPLTRNDAFELDVSALQKTVQTSVCPQYSNKKDRHWKVWNDYCVSEGIDPLLRAPLTRDPLIYLRVFAARYRDGRIAPGGKPVAFRTVEDAVRSVGQRLSVLGSKDPRFDSAGNTVYAYKAQLQSYKREDKPPKRAKPLPITVVQAALAAAFGGDQADAREQALANMVCIAFYYCLRPGEYTGTTDDDAIFSLDDVTFFWDTKRLNNNTSPTAEFERATAIHLTFTTQKNGIKGDVIAHARSSHPLCCPVTSAVRQFLTHRTHFQATGSPYNGAVALSSFYSPTGTCLPITASQVTTYLRHHVGLLEPVTGISPASITARSLRAGGAMALLNSGCDTNVLQLVARWHGDAMMRYLHQQALPVFSRLAVKMYNNGTYSFLPEEWVPSTVHDDDPAPEMEPPIPETQPDVSPTPIRQLNPSKIPTMAARRSRRLDRLPPVATTGPIPRNLH